MNLSRLNTFEKVLTLVIVGLAFAVALSAAVAVGMVVFGSLLWTSWNHSVAHMDHVGTIGWAQACWTVLLAAVLRVLINPNAASGSKTKAK